MTSSNILQFTVSDPAISQKDADGIDLIGGINGVSHIEVDFKETMSTNHLVIKIHMKYNVQSCELIDLKDDACIYLSSSESVKADSLTLVSEDVSVADKPAPVMTDAQKLTRINQILALAGDWCQEQVLPESNICMSALKDVRRVMKGHPSAPAMTLDLNLFDSHGNGISGNKSLNLTPASLTDVIDHAAQLTLVMRSQLQYISDQNIINAMTELSEALVTAGIISENWREGSLDAPSCHQCGESFTLDSEGVANHTDDNADVDHDADADHTPYTLEGK